MTHVRVWKFRPPAGGEREFAEAYGSDGAWARLFGRASGYRGTTLMTPVEPGGWWMTIDRWAGPGDFEAFGHDFGKDYRELDANLEGVAGEEEFVGAFEEPEL